ncbi:MAG: tam [Pseudonocardia sp.]|nr:tam [Pseudonocardia sp.]
MRWDPSGYLEFQQPRGRAFHDLVARVDAQLPRRVVDLGCGPGHLTTSLTQRWPAALIEAFDSSVEMVQQARELGLNAMLLDADEWMPLADTDVVVCNAVLQWVPGHVELIRRWMAALPPGAWFAMQVPGNFDAPSHLLVRELASQLHWRDLVPELHEAPVCDAAEYAELFAATGADVDAWETTYLHRLGGPNPVLEWIRSTALRPVRTALNDEQWAAFRAELAPTLEAAYPRRPDGTTWFPFRRIFAVAHLPERQS